MLINLTAEPQTVPSNELRGDRHPSGQFLTGLDVGGSLESELALTDPLDDLLEGLFMSAWTTDTISLGSTEKSVFDSATICCRIAVSDHDRDESGVNEF